MNLTDAELVATFVAALFIVSGAVASIIAAGIIAATKYRAVTIAVAKAALWGLIALVSFVVLWFAANRLLDESPDPNRETFLVSPSDQLPDERNIAIGILGLTAPSGQDFVQYGAKLKSLEMANAQSSEYKDMLWGLWGPKALQPTRESQGIWCRKYPDDPEIKNCIPLEEAPAILMQNSELIARYRVLHRLGAYSSSWWGGNRAYLDVTALALAEVHLDLKRNQRESAYRKWRDQLLLVRTTLRGPDTWIGKAVSIVATKSTLAELENILRVDPRLAKQHAAELKNLLRPEGIDGFSLEGVLRAEYLSLKDALYSPQSQMRIWGLGSHSWLPSYLIQKDRLLNRYYFFARDYAAILRLPWSQFEKEVVRWRESFAYPSGWDITVDPVGSLFFSFYIENQLKARELVTSMYEIDGTLKLSTLLVRIISEDVADSAISDFLASVGPELYNPFSGDPMRWDPTQRRIYFSDPEYPSGKGISLRVPPKRGAKPMAVR